MTTESGPKKGGVADTVPARETWLMQPLLEPRFDPGQLVITSNAKDVLLPEDVLLALQRHLSGDWGNVGDVDQRVNDLGLAEGNRLFSVYRAQNGTKFWIITEWDRSSTTVLLPEDY